MSRGKDKSATAAVSWGTSKELQYARENQQKRKQRKEKANHIGESEGRREMGDSIGQVSEDFIWAAEVSPKSKMAELQLTALDQGNWSKQIKADLLIDSGVYRTLLTEEQWRQI